MKVTNPKPLPFKNRSIGQWHSGTWDVTVTNFTTHSNVMFVLPTTALTTVPSQTAAPNFTTNWWNPAVGSSCSNLHIGYDVCVGVASSTTGTTTSTTTATITTPSPLMPSTVADCTEFYYVIPGDSCASIQEAYGLTAAEFNEFNPGMGSDCTNLWLDTYICVAAQRSSQTITVTSTSTSVTATTTTTATTTVPSPLMPSTVSGCADYYYVVDGDTCSSIE
ncbi:hypothetical protein BDV11DRAFT_166643 [Aspergillus similis]